MTRKVSYSWRLDTITNWQVFQAVTNVFFHKLRIMFPAEVLSLFTWVSYRPALRTRAFQVS